MPIHTETGPAASGYGHAYLPVQSTLPDTKALLLQGGDARIALGADGTNKYGCAPFPDDAIAAFGSSTASSISANGFAAADRLRQRLLLAADSELPAVTYAREITRIRHDLTQLCNLHNVPDTEVVFAASGTDLHLLVSQLIDRNTEQAALVIMVDPEETGRGVPLAIAGKHFNPHAALGAPVDEGKSIAGGSALDVRTIAVRSADGMPRLAEEIDADVYALAAAAAARRQRVLVVMADLTKTGMIAPSIACATTLRQRFPDCVNVMVDACQFRIADATLHAYLQRDFMVAVTGSKFLTGPTFAGALFIPASRARHLRNQPLPPVLSAYSSSLDWPEDWAAGKTLHRVANFGLLLRWEAALAELRAFRQVADAVTLSFVETFGQTVRQAITDNPIFAPVAVPRIDRRALLATRQWDQLPTVFPFVLFTANRRPLTREQTMTVYKLLQCDLRDRADLPPFDDNALAALRCQIGQPVACGTLDDMPVSALRLCLSARHMVTANTPDGAALVIHHAMQVLKKAALLAAAVA